MTALAACLCLAGCGGEAPSTATTSGKAVTHALAGAARARGAVAASGSATSGRAAAGSAHAVAGSARAVAEADPCPPSSSGTLAQTNQLPSATSACFHAIVRALWQAIREDSTRGARYAFFPLPAYEQVKAIGDARGDYNSRLLGEYALDIHSAHGLLGADAGATRLVRAIVPQGYVHWVSPGACYNRLGYYEVPNSRVVYRVGQHDRSFGIASMISWRGTWYVVHLGAVTRSGSGGTVDDPSDGPGTPVASLTC